MDSLKPTNLIHHSPTSCRHFTSFSFQPSLKFSTAHFEGSTGPIIPETMFSIFLFAFFATLSQNGKVTTNWVRLFSLFVRKPFSTFCFSKLLFQPRSHVACDEKQGDKDSNVDARFAATSAQTKLLRSISICFQKGLLAQRGWHLSKLCFVAVTLSVCEIINISCSRAQTMRRWLTFRNILILVTNIIFLIALILRSNTLLSTQMLTDFLLTDICALIFAHWYLHIDICSGSLPIKTISAEMEIARMKRTRWPL